jgi:seryl-tRNA synthetase
VSALTLPRAQRLASIRPVTEAIGAILDVDIDSTETETMAREILAQANAVLKAVEDQRVEETAPLLAATKELDAEYKAAVEPLKRVEATLRARLEGWLLLLEERRKAALREAQAASLALAHVEANAAIVKVSEAAPAVVAKQFDRYTWAVQHVDESRIPRQYMSADARKIQAEIKRADAHGIEPVIEGVTFRREIATTVRR